MKTITTELMPSIFEFPYALEITELGTNVTTREYFKEPQPVIDRVNAINQEEFFASGWNREKSELICETHPDVIEPSLVITEQTVQEQSPASPVRV